MSSSKNVGHKRAWRCKFKPDKDTDGKFDSSQFVRIFCFAHSFLPSLHRGETCQNLLKFCRHKETNTQDFRSIYFNLFLVILLKFGFSSSHTNPYMAPHCLGFLCFLWENKTLGGFNTCDLQYVDIHIWRNVFFLNCLYGFSNKVEFLQMHWRHKTEIFFLPAISNTI